MPLQLCYLQLIKWTTPQGETRRFRLIERVSSKWRKFGGRISLHPNVMDGWRQCGETAESCWEKTMQLWLDGQGNKEYPASWESLYEMLEDVQLGGVVPDLKEAVNGASAQR